MDNKAVIISGANGFVGSHTVKKFLSNGYRVFAIVHESNNNLTDLMCKNLQIIKDDISFLSQLKYNSIESFIEFAWCGTSGNLRFDDSIQHNNIITVIKHLEIAKKLNCKRFIYAGSIAEYNVDLTDWSSDSINYYSYCKRIAHIEAEELAKYLGIQFVCARITNAYGEGEVSKRLIYTTINKIVDGCDTLQFSDATTQYTFVHVDDVANAFYCISNAKTVHSDYTICGGEVKPLREYLSDLVNIVSDLHFTEDEKKKVQVIFGAIKSTEKELTKRQLNSKKLYNDTGYKAEISFKDGITRTYNYIVEGDNHG